MDQQPESFTPNQSNQLQPVQKKICGLAIAAFVVSILGILGSLIPIINNASFFFGLAGLVLGVVALIIVIKKKKKGLGLTIAALVVAVLTMVLVLATQSYWGKSLDRITGDATETVLEETCDVQIGEFVLTKDEWGWIDSALKVTVTNKDTEAHSFDIEIEAVDANGNRLDEDWIFANDLGAGQSQTFDCFVFVTEDEYDAMSCATFKIMSVSEM